MYEAGASHHPKLQQYVTTAVFLDIEKGFDKAWYSGLLYKLSELGILTSLIKLITSLLTNRKFNVLVKVKKDKR
jgi:hypothetical protein